MAQTPVSEIKPLSVLSEQQLAAAKKMLNDQPHTIPNPRNNTLITKLEEAGVAYEILGQDPSSSGEQKNQNLNDFRALAFSLLFGSSA